MEVSLMAALTAGLLSFVSPCVLPLVPAYLSYMTGISVEGLKQRERGGLGGQWLVISHGLAFVAGFSLVFILLGASSTLLGRMLLAYMDILGKVGGIIIIILGIHYMGIFRIGFLDMEARFNVEEKPGGVSGSFLIGLAFAFGWTPCVGPILAAILAVAGAQETVTEGILLLAVYSMGLGVPFLLAGMATNSFFAFFTRIKKHLHKIEMVSGLLLVAVGILIFMGDFTRLSVLLLQWFPELATLG
ncbi:MAG: cytochrome c biogenesis protein CcdA [Magnetococcales bacterium]|nr:cytochrome c biogenesis protein CcdA [Magnetococcales bacterium]NGZ25273.1 cytochrome c biogenesis protein CcdA [Magnetococcales bacterium]